MDPYDSDKYVEPHDDPYVKDYDPYVDYCDPENYGDPYVDPNGKCHIHDPKDCEKEPKSN